MSWVAWPAGGRSPAGACRWCGRDFDGRSMVARGRVRCGACGVWTTWPPPTDAQLEAAYGGWYRPAGGRFGGPGDAVLRRTRAALARTIDTFAPPGRVLDVGSGDGTLVAALQTRGRDAEGLERGDPPLEQRPGEYAAIVFWHSLEHLPSPVASLRAAAERLAPGGVLAVAVPNAGSEQAARLRERWFAWDVPRHLVHITAAALRAECEAAGLEVVRESHLRGGQVVFGWLHGLVGRATGVDLYDAIRRPEARSAPLTAGERLRALAAAGALLPLAAALAVGEARSRRGGTVFVLARRAR